MRTIKNLSVPQNTDAKFPFSTIQNETDVLPGTPVVEEIYGDLLTNIYKILQTVGIAPSGTQDNDLTQYQILEAIQKLPNVINDAEHTLSLTGTVWSVPLKIEFLPNKFVFFARAAESFIPGTTYTFKGNGTATALPISCPEGFDATAELMVVIDTSTVRVFPLTTPGATDKIITTPLGAPLAFNNTKFLYFLENGKLYSDSPSVHDIQETIRDNQGDPFLVVLQAFLVKGKLLCFVIDGDDVYKFFQFNLIGLNSPQYVDYDIDSSTDNAPYCYTDGTYIYLTNDANTSSDDFVFRKLNYDTVNSEMTVNSTVFLENSFYKTTNAVMTEDSIITLVSGELNKFGINDETKYPLGVYETAIGQLFYFKSNFYFGTGEVATKWSL